MGQLKMRKRTMQAVSFFNYLLVFAIVNSLFIFLTGNTPAESDCSNVTQCTANEPFWCNPTDNGICQEMKEDNTCQNNGGLLERQHFNEGDPPICPSGSILLSETVNNFTRYSCHTINTATGELPLIVFLPGTGTYASQAYQMTTLDEHMNDAGGKYHLLSLQARQLCIPGEAKLDDLPVLDPIRWEVSYRDPLNNDDMQYIDRMIKFFIDTTAPGRVDKKRIYVVGHSNGAAMAAFYGIQRNAWQQGFPGIAAVIQWEGADPWAS